MIGEPYMIKIAFFDIDGTLLKMGCKEPTDKTVKALNSLTLCDYSCHINIYPK